MKTRYSEHEVKSTYDDMLDEVYGAVDVSGLSYYTSHVLSEIDPTAYRCGFADWCSTEYEEHTDVDGTIYYTRQDDEDE